MILMMSLQALPFILLDISLWRKPGFFGEVFIRIYLNFTRTCVRRGVTGLDLGFRIQVTVVTVRKELTRILL